MRDFLIGILACAFLMAAGRFVGNEPVPPPEPSAYDNENAGLARDARPETLSWDRIYALAIVRARSRRGAFAPTLDPAALADEARAQGRMPTSRRFRTNFHSNGPFHDPGPAVFAASAGSWPSTTRDEMSRFTRIFTSC